MSLAVGVSGLMGPIEAQGGSPVETRRSPRWRVDADLPVVRAQGLRRVRLQRRGPEPLALRDRRAERHLQGLPGGRRVQARPLHAPRRSTPMATTRTRAAARTSGSSGGTVELTNWLTSYLEYVKWDVDSPRGPRRPVRGRLPDRPQLALLEVSPGRRRDRRRPGLGIAGLGPASDRRHVCGHDAPEHPPQRTRISIEAAFPSSTTTLSSTPFRLPFSSYALMRWPRASSRTSRAPAASVERLRLVLS